jgi:hypothetical protein
MCEIKRKKSVIIIICLDSCNSNWNVEVSAGAGFINVSWTPLTPGSNYTYLVLYNSTSRGVKNFTMVSDSTSARIDYLSTNALYSIQLVAFVSSSNAASIYSCPRLLKTNQGNYDNMHEKHFNCYSLRVSLIVHTIQDNVISISL